MTLPKSPTAPADGQAVRSARRVVTGHDQHGKSVFLSDGPPPQFHGLKRPGVEFIEVWSTDAALPAIAPSEPEPNDRPLTLGPGGPGSRLRLLDLHPLEKLVAPAPGKPRPGMHRTETIDYGIVLEGEVYLVLSDSERLLQPGDVVIQRGTDHAWENRSDKPVRMAFVLLGGQFDPALKEVLGDVKLVR